jgi:hypothetical protein
MSSGMWDGGDELFGALSQDIPDFTTHLPALENYTLPCIARRFLIQQRFLMINAALGGEPLLERVAESNSLCCFTKTGCWLCLAL